MKQSIVRGLVAITLASASVVSCSSSDQREAPSGRTQQALTPIERIFLYEGPIGSGQQNPDWLAVSGAAVANTMTPFEGMQALDLTGANPKAISTFISTLGPIANEATLQVKAPATIPIESNWYGHVALRFSCPSRGLYDQYVQGPVITPPLGVYKHYGISLPPHLGKILSAGKTTTPTWPRRLAAEPRAQAASVTLRYYQSESRSGTGVLMPRRSKGGIATFPMRVAQYRVAGPVVDSRSKSVVAAGAYLHG